jgi:hypothetical protein
MTTRPDDDRTLDAALARLPRDVEPPRDLWTGIEAGIAGRPDRGGMRWPWAAAAAVVLVAASSLITANLVREESAPVATAPVPGEPALQVASTAFGPGHTLDPAYDAARRNLAEELSRRIDRMPPSARQRLEANLGELRRASAEINGLLAERPGDPLLEELLLATYQDELAVLANASQITAAADLRAAADETRKRIPL